MEKIWLAIKELLNLPKEKLPLALLMIVCVFMYYKWMQTDGRLAGKEIEVHNLNLQLLQVANDERTREREYREEKFNAIIKEKENCEIEKQNIYKKQTSNAGKITK